MKKEELIERFNKLEREILKLINLPEINLDELEKKQSIKSVIKKHIVAVEKAKALFEEYETIAEQIENFDKPKKTAKKEEAVDKTSDSGQDRKIEKYEDQVVNNGEDVKVVKKKKIKTSSKQM